MEFSLLAMIGIGLATMFFGYFFGLFEGRGQGYKKGRTEEAAAQSLKAAAQPPAPPAPPRAPVVQAGPVDKSLLRLSVDDREQPCLDLDGERVDTGQIAPHQRKRLIDLMVMMRPWIEAPSGQKPQTMAVPPPPPKPAPEPALAQPPAAQPAVTSAAAPEPPVSAPTTMVGQIDAILQGMLAGSPLASRGIRLVESLQGGASVVVGLQNYAGVGEVPDPEVQAIIRAAIAEWEKKYTPG